MPFAEGKKVSDGLPKEIAVDDDGKQYTIAASAYGDNDLVFDYGAAIYKTAVTASTHLLDIPAEDDSIRFMRIVTDQIVFLNNVSPAAAANGNIMIAPLVPEIIPVVPGDTFYVFAAVAAVVQATPMYQRPAFVAP